MYKEKLEKPATSATPTKKQPIRAAKAWSRSRVFTLLME